MNLLQFETVWVKSFATQDQWKLAKNVQNKIKESIMQDPNLISQTQYLIR